MPQNDNRVLYVVTGLQAGVMAVEVFSQPAAAEAFRQRLTSGLVSLRVLDSAAHWGVAR